jgi:hypothetical protein
LEKIMKHSWRNTLTLAFVVLMFGWNLPAAAPAPGDEVPKIILSGLKAYKAEGPEAALKAWLKGSPLEGSREALSQANVLRQIQDIYGAYKGFDLIRSRDISPTTRIFYMTINYEKSPVFAKFVVYRTQQGWIITTFIFNTKEELILPACP